MSVVRYVRDARVGGRRRTGRLMVALVGAGLMLAGCGTVPGAAAVVDGIRISEQTVLDRTQALVQENVSDATQTVDPVALQQLNQYQVTDVVRHQLIRSIAASQHITVTSAQVDAYIAQQGGTAELLGSSNMVIPTDAVPDAVYDYLVLQQLVDKLPAAGVDVTNVQITVDVVLAPDRDTAVADRARYLNDPAAMDADAAAARQSNPQLPGGQESLLAAASDARVGIFTAPQGQIVLYPAGSQGYYVIRVTKRTEQPAKLTKDMIGGTSDIDSYTVLASLLLSRYPEAAKVTVNPRFGQWDPKTMLVVAPNNGM